MAQTRVLLPVPFGPMIILRLGPKWNSAEVYVTKLVSLTRTIDPGWYRSGTCSPLPPLLERLRDTCAWRARLPDVEAEDISSSSSTVSEGRFRELKMLDIAIQAQVNPVVCEMVSLDGMAYMQSRGSRLPRLLIAPERVA